MPTPSASEPLSASERARFRDDYSRLPGASWNRPSLVAVSGGADSLALLLLMHAELGENCHAATVDHGIRQDSAADADFVAAVCCERGIPHATLRGPLPPRVGRSGNLSQRARALRYGLLEQYRESIGAGCITTAHHADDQVETVIMRLNRGAGLAGLAGVRAHQGRIMRPLLTWKHEELADIVRRHGLTPIDDPSNRDDRFDRARLRKVLAGADWIDAVQVARSANHLAEAEEGLEWLMEKMGERLCSFDGHEASHASETLPPAILRRVVKRCILHIDPNADCNGPAIARVIAALRGDKGMTTIGEVLCRNEFVPRLGVTQMPMWSYRRAPPRRHG